MVQSPAVLRCGLPHLQACPADCWLEGCNRATLNAYCPQGSPRQTFRWGKTTWNPWRLCQCVWFLMGAERCLHATNGDPTMAFQGPLLSSETPEEWDWMNAGIVSTWDLILNPKSWRLEHFVPVLSAIPKETEALNSQNALNMSQRWALRYTHRECWVCI